VIVALTALALGLAMARAYFDGRESRERTPNTPA